MYRLCVSVDKPLVVFIPFSILFMLCQICIITYQFQDIWRIFTRVRARTDRQTDGRTDRQTDIQTSRMHKHFSTSFESVKNNHIYSYKKRKHWMYFIVFWVKFYWFAFSLDKNIPWYFNLNFNLKFFNIFSNFFFQIRSNNA